MRRIYPHRELSPDVPTVLQCTAQSQRDFDYHRLHKRGGYHPLRDDSLLRHEREQRTSRATREAPRANAEVKIELESFDARETKDSETDTKRQLPASASIM